MTYPAETRPNATGIWWLASYPKSGNTWVRAFLANLLSGADEPVDINRLETGEIASTREWVERGAGIDLSELSHEEVDRVRPGAYRWLSANTATNFHKVHDAYTFLRNGSPLFPADATRGAVVIVRNPLDVVPSYASHCSVRMEKAVHQICCPYNGFSKAVRHQVPQLRQKFGTWSEHVLSWLDADIPKLVVRYEDLKTDPVRGFTRITRFLQLAEPEERIARAVEFCRFENLRRQEDQSGFKEKNGRVKNFFRQGKVGGWREELSAEQVRQIVETNQPAMDRLGYRFEDGDLRISDDWTARPRPS